MARHRPIFNQLAPTTIAGKLTGAGTYALGRSWRPMTFGCSTCGPNRKNSAGKGGSHEDGCDGLARGQTSPPR